MQKLRGKIRRHEFCPLHEITGFPLKLFFRIRILREFGELTDFDPATGVSGDFCPKKTKKQKKIQNLVVY